MKKTSASNRKIVWILGSLSTITPFAIDLYLPAFARLAQDFGTNTATISLSVSSYFIGMALGQVLYGPFLDRFGRKPPLYVGLSLFVLASFGCTLSWDVTSLVAFRFLQAIGGSVAWVAAVAMVRDFFPVEASARIYSLLFLIIGVSPLLAPTIGGLIVTSLGWQAIFIFLMVIAILIVLLVIFFLPEGHAPDPTITIRLKPMLLTFYDILKNPVFSKYVFAGAFSFSTLFIYVAGSPIIFMELYHVSPNVYGGIFALLSVGFIGGGQVNILLTKKFSSEQIFRAALIAQVIASTLFFIGVATEALGLYGIIAMFFICLSCLGLTNPNANALALAPFTRTVGSASALLGFIQIGVASLMSAGVGVFNITNALPSVALMCGTSIVALLLLTFFSAKELKRVD
ncbi:MAG: drug resistance transporter, Bcr/CflA family [Bacteroidota bacterium]